MQQTTSQITARYNIYGNIHKALRAFMSDTLALCGRTDWPDAIDRRCTLEQLDSLLTLCEMHLTHENDFVHAAMEARRPGSSGSTAGDHVEHCAAISALRDAAQRLANGQESAPELAGTSLYRKLALFVAENFEHMAVEETDNNAVLWACYSDEEIHGIERDLVAHIDPAHKSLVMRWMLPALSATERGMLLQGLKQQLPAEAFDGLLSSIKPLLDTRSRIKLDLAMA